MTTTHTLKDARRAGACDDGYKRFRAALRAAYPDAKNLDAIRWSIGDVARVDFNDALWCLCLVDDARVRVAAIMPAVKRAAVHTDDVRVRDCIAAIERWLAGDDGVDWDAARAAAGAAARAAAGAAWDAAGAAAWAAAGDAAHRKMCNIIRKKIKICA